MAKDKKDSKPEATAAPAEAKAAPAPAAPRAPVDMRLKVMKKFQGRFLPKGPLRERLNAIMTRWNADENHGDVTVDELKTLLVDWRNSRVHPKKRAAQA